VYCSVNQLQYCSRSVGLTFKLDSNPYAIQQLGFRRRNNSQLVPWIINLVQFFKFRDVFADEQLCYATTVDPRFKMVAFDSDEQSKHAVDAILRAMEGATGMSQQADQPSVPPASAQASKPLSLWSKFDEASAGDGASLTFRSPHALRHEFESYLREPKIARTSSPFAGLTH